MSDPLTIETKRETRFLRCTLTLSELLEAGKAHADKSIELAQLEADKKRVMDDFKAKTSALEAEGAQLASKISSGYEFRNVACTVWLDEPKRGSKRITRDDTNEDIGVEAMTPAELQRTLPV